MTDLVHQQAIRIENLQIQQDLQADQLKHIAEQLKILDGRVKHFAEQLNIRFDASFLKLAPFAQRMEANDMELKASMEDSSEKLQAYEAHDALNLNVPRQAFAEQSQSELPIIQNSAKAMDFTGPGSTISPKMHGTP